MEECGFNIAWVGKCKNPKPCPDHKDKVCCVCGESATRECPETFSLVCGALLCDNCEHSNRNWGHVRKGSNKVVSFRDWKSN